VYVFGQAANAQILGDGHKRFTWREALRPLEAVDGPTALPLTDGEDHDRRRRLVQPAFATRRIDAAVPLIVAEVDTVINGLRVGDTVDLYALYRAAVYAMTSASLPRAVATLQTINKASVDSKKLAALQASIDQRQKGQVPWVLDRW